MTIGLELAEGGVRWFDGIVSRFALAGTSGRYIHYQAEQAVKASKDVAINGKKVLQN